MKLTQNPSFDTEMEQETKRKDLSRSDSNHRQGLILRGGMGGHVSSNIWTRGNKIPFSPQIYGKLKDIIPKFVQDKYLLYVNLCCFS